MAVEEKTNTEVVFEKLGFKPKRFLREYFAADMPSSPEEAHDRVAYFTFESRVNAILQLHSKRSDDRVFLLNLGNLRRVIGDKWEKNSKQIHKNIHSILHDSLISDDIYMKRDDFAYVIAMSDIKLARAQLKMQVIAEAIGESIVGKKVPNLITVKDVKISWPKHAKLQDTPNKDDIIHGMLAEDDTRRKNALSQLEEGASSSLFDGVKFIFRPMLAVRTQVISTHICIPIKPGGHGGYFSGYDVIGHKPSIETIFELDQMTQELVQKELMVMVANNVRSLLALPVHFETLASHHRQQYLTRARELFGERAKRIIYELVGVPHHIPQSRMLEFTSALKPHSRAVIARFPTSHGAFESYRSVGLHAVGVDLYSSDKPERTLFKGLEQFVDHANKAQLKTYAHGIHSVSLYTASVCAGFDYLDGYALSSVLDQAKDISAFSYDMLYRDLSRKDSVSRQAREQGG